MDDADLVLAARSGDREALAAIYDRYADRLHDYCWSILRDPHEAADAFHDAFLAAAQRLDQLRDPSKLRPWLYAIARHEALRRATARGRQQPTEEVDDVRATGADVDEPYRQEEAAALVWAAAAGLAPRDRALLDLNLRQGLEGQDLADAIGVETGHAYVLLSRLRDQVERSLGALLVARYGRRDCPDLARILEGWDGRFSPILRKRVARHADGCSTCSDRRRVLASPTALLGVVPLVPAPAHLKDRILGQVQLTAAKGWPADLGGFPPPMYPSSSPSRRTFLAVAGAAAAVVVAALVLGAVRRDGAEVPLATALAPTTQATTIDAAAPPPDPTVPAPATTTPTPAPTAPLTTAGTGPRLRLSATALAFGATATAQALEIANDGDAPLAWSAVSAPASFSLSPASGTVAPRATARVTVRLDRSVPAEGRLDGQVRITSDGGSDAVRLTASVTRPPEIGRIAVDNPRLAASPCSIAPTAASVTTTVTDETGVASAVLHWRDPAGATGTRPMVAGTGSAYSGRLGPFTATGTVTWWIEATDTLGASGRSADQTATVAACR